jgi:hypothetical protein
VLSYCSRKIQDFFTLNAGKRKREDFASQYHPGGFIPQQDGAGDAAFEVFEIEVCPLLFLFICWMNKMLNAFLLLDKFGLN